MPPRWHRFSVPLCFRGARLEIEVRRQGRGARAAERLGITVENVPVRVVLDGRERTLVAGRFMHCREQSGTCESDGGELHAPQLRERFRLRAVPCLRVSV